jgi:NAD(P)-dependent dehydrogenase (short-subunit alcohol dehydrogenase family)
MMDSFANKRVVVVGGSRGLGLGMVEALVERGAQVTVVARNADTLRAVSERLSIDAVVGDAADASLAAELLARVRPDLLIVNAGVTPISAGMRDITWDTFSSVWNVDVQAGFHWAQAALRLPLAAGARVLLLSSGAAIYGVPNTGSYSGAKRMLWLMAHYANAESQKLGLGVHFQTVVPLGLVPDTGVGQMAAAFHAKNRGMSVEAFWETCRPSLSARQVGEYVATLYGDPAYATGVAFGVNGAAGITALDTKD